MMKQKFDDIDKELRLVEMEEEMRVKDLINPRNSLNQISTTQHWKMRFLRENVKTEAAEPSNAQFELDFYDKVNDGRVSEENIEENEVVEVHVKKKEETRNIRESQFENESESDLTKA
jgi:hypothetical protein